MNQQPNRARKNLYDFLLTQAETAVDIFWGNHIVDEDDKALLSEADYVQAINTACAMVAYKQLSYENTGHVVEDKALFLEMEQQEGDSSTTFLSCELALEYGRQLHNLMAQRAIESYVGGNDDVCTE